MRGPWAHERSSTFGVSSTTDGPCACLDRADDHEGVRWGVDSTGLSYARRGMSCEPPITVRVRAPHGLDILPGWVDLSGPGPGVVVATFAVAAARFAWLYAGLAATRGFAPRD